jgi:prepilin-type N-terminal cleavage/methylation domain-containing protein
MNMRSIDLPTRSGRIVSSGTRSGEEGFTLVELIVAVFILSLLVFATFNLLDAHLSEGEVVVSASDIAEELRMAMDTMVDQLRTASTFTSAKSNDLTFQGYVLGNNVLQTVRFFLDGDELKMTCSDLFAGEKVIASGVKSLAFTYYDKADTQLTNPDGSQAIRDSITQVEITLTLARSGGGVTVDKTATTRVRIKK